MEHLSVTDVDYGIRGEEQKAILEAIALKRHLAQRIRTLMEEEQLSKSAMAEKMNTSRSSLNRLLDPSNISITLQTLERAALALGKKLNIEML